jgi:Flp pilus assembly protein CpaB
MRRATGMVTAPVRIADAATVLLLRPGDRVDVIAAEETATGGEARVVARGARVTKVPQSPEAAGESGALVVLSVPRSTAARLAGASTTARLAVTLC